MSVTLDFLQLFLAGDHVLEVEDGDMNSGSSRNAPQSTERRFQHSRLLRTLEQNSATGTLVLPTFEIREDSILFAFLKSITFP